MKLTRDGLLTAIIVVAALFLGSQVVQLIPSPDDQFGRPFEHHAAVGEATTVRSGTLTVTGLQAGKEIEINGAVAATTALWLVVDFDWLTTDRPRGYSVASIELVAADGRTFGGSAPIPSACSPGQPHITLSCQAPFEVPTDALPGAIVRLPAGTGTELDDVVIVDLGIDEARAAELAASTGQLNLTGAVAKP